MGGVCVCVCVRLVAFCALSNRCLLGLCLQVWENAARALATADPVMAESALREAALLGRDCLPPQDAAQLRGLLALTPSQLQQLQLKQALQAGDVETAARATMAAKRTFLEVCSC